MSDSCAAKRQRETIGNTAACQMPGGHTFEIEHISIMLQHICICQAVPLTAWHKLLVMHCIAATAA
jgi:hypothetical protein